jgi:glycosyltransferase involved in cell wall biosynthesis
MGNKTLRLSNKIIATSKFYAENSPYLKKYSSKINIISPGVQLPNAKEFKKIKDQVLFVGQLDKTHTHKGLNYLIDSINKVKNEIKDVKLYVIGKGDNLEHYEEYVNKLGLQDNIIFTGFVSDKELDNYYTKSEIIVLPSSNNAEGFGMVLIEGMAHKCVSIGTNVGGIPYVINNNKDGLLVPPKDPKALAEAITKLLKNQTLAGKIGENGYKKVKENFTWKIQVKETDRVLKGVLR